MSYRSAGPVNLNEFKSIYQDEFLEKLDTLLNPKAIYWEQSLMSPMSSVVGHSLLKDHGVSNSFLLENSDTSCSPPDSKAVIFVLSSNIKSLDCVQSFVRRDLKFYKKPKKEYHIIAVPSLSYACKNFLKEKDVLRIFSSIHEFPLTLLPLDTDVLSMEEPNCFAHYTLLQQQRSVYNFVQGLIHFQKVYGLFPIIRAKGNKAQEIARMLIRMRQEMEVSKPDRYPLSSMGSQTALLVILDRSIDCLTPLLSQLTYEGLISQKWGINYGVCRIPSQLADPPTSTQRVPLNAQDQLFTELRDQNFPSAASILSKRSKEDADLVVETKAIKELPQLRQVCNQLPEILSARKALKTHVEIAEQLQQYVFTDDFMSNLSTEQDFLSGVETGKAHPFIEDCLLRGAPIETVLRLMCIQCFCNGGLKQQLLEYYKREVLQVYGFEHAFTLDNLDRVGLLYDSSTKTGHRGAINLPLVSDTSTSAHLSTVRSTVTAVSSMFATNLKRTLQLWMPSGNPDSADCDQVLSTIYSGYIPISVRIVQALCMGWLPKTVSSINGQLISAGTPYATALKASALLTGKTLGAPSENQGNNPASAAPIEATTESALRHGTNYVGTLLPGALIEERQVFDPVGNFEESTDKQTGRTKVVAVAFVGGVTHAEVSALRTLAANCDDDSWRSIGIRPQTSSYGSPQARLLTFVPVKFHTTDRRNWSQPTNYTIYIG